jgi:predicted DCC family thiol-disulfide oxidoreductase YuxK
MADRPVLLYDGQCGFCTWMVELALDRLGLDADVAPWQTADLGALAVSRAEAEHSVQWVEPTGEISAGAQAAGRLLLRVGGAWSLLGRLLLIPPFSLLGELAYRAVSAVRGRLPVTRPALSRPPGQRPGRH